MTKDEEIYILKKQLELEKSKIMTKKEIKKIMEKEDDMYKRLHEIVAPTNKKELFDIICAIVETEIELTALDGQ